MIIIEEPRMLGDGRAKFHIYDTSKNQTYFLHYGKLGDNLQKEYKFLKEVLNKNYSKKLYTYGGCSKN